VTNKIYNLPNVLKLPKVKHILKMQGFTLLELMVVVAIIGISMGLISLAIRDSPSQDLQMEARKLAARIELARVRSRSSGAIVLWQPTEKGYRFSGLESQELDSQWSNPKIKIDSAAIVLGPEPVLPPQSITLTYDRQSIRIGSDGVGAFAILPSP
jgi:general secretion pathway protein H